MNTQNRRPFSSQKPRRSQDRPVAPEGDHKIGLGQVNRKAPAFKLFGNFVRGRRNEAVFDLTDYPDGFHVILL